MKTPRQILLEEHGAADAQLERIQSRVLAQELGQAHFSNRLSSLLAIVWTELILPARRTWAGFAVAWLFIAMINLADTTEAARPSAGNPPTSTTTLAAWKEQQRLALKLADPLELQVAEPPKPLAPQPRSNRSQTIAIG